MHSIPRNPSFGESLSMGGRDEPRLTIRLAQPIEGYASEAFLLGVGVDGTLIPKHSLTSTTKWYRSKSFRVCGNMRCPYYGNNAGEPPSGNGAPTITPPPDMVLHCRALERLGFPRALTYFCSSACLAMYWPNKPKGSIVSKEGGGGKTEEIEGIWSLEDEAPKDVVIPGREEGWELVSDNRQYVPTMDDVWHKLKVEVTATFPDGRVLRQTAFSRCVFPKPPEARPRYFSTRHLQQPSSGTEAVPVFPSLPKGHPLTHVGDQGSEDPAARHSIRVFSYNILAEIFAGQSAYPYAEQWELSWAYRRHKILQEILTANADIICLQEAQADSFESFLHPVLAEKGYDAVYKQKTREAMGTAGRVDGCALFFKRSRFRAVEKYVIEFNDAAVEMAKKEPPDASGMVERGLKRLMRDNVAQVVVLELLATRNGEPLGSAVPLCVANTHLFWDPDYADVKLWQVHMLTQELERLTSPRQLPLILCGDFNSEPGSAVHRLLSLNAVAGQAGIELQPQHLPHDPCGILRTRGRLNHSLFLRSAYAEAEGREPEFTNYTGNFKGCLDYIWVTSNLVNVTSALGLPPAEDLVSYAGKPLPNAQYPSDHLSLIIDVRLKSLDIPTTMRGAQGYPAPAPSDVPDLLKSDEDFAPPTADGQGTPGRRGSGSHQMGSPVYSDNSYGSSSLSPARSPGMSQAYGQMQGMGSPGGYPGPGNRGGNGGAMADGGVAMGRSGRGRARGGRGGGNSSKRGGRVGKTLFMSPSKQRGSGQYKDSDGEDDSDRRRNGRSQGRRGSVDSWKSTGSQGEWVDSLTRSLSNSGRAGMPPRY